MNIYTIRTSFSPFSDELMVMVEYGNASIRLEVGQRELRGFARSLIDVADDCLRKLKDRSEEDDQAITMVRDALDAVSAI